MVHFKLLPILVMAISCNSQKPLDGGKDTIKTKVGEQITIELGVNMGTGYRWQLTEGNHRELLVMDTSFVSDVADKDGSPGTQVFRFTAVRKGTARLDFEHTRPWKKDEVPDKRRDFTILVE